MEQQGERFLVLGLGVSGLAAAEFLLAQGKAVIGVDRFPDKVLEQPQAKRLQEKGALILPDQEDPRLFSELQEIAGVIVSPGVDPNHPLYVRAQEKGLPIIGELELALRQVQKRCVAITGTNGKTTVTLLVSHILNQNGIRARSLGNIGDPLTTYLLENREEEVLVIEVSSYQLETMKIPVFEVGVILNITPDHLDRYQSMSAYAAAKCRLRLCMKKGKPLYAPTRVFKEFGELLQGEDIFPYDLGSEQRELEPFLPPSYAEMGSHDRENVLAAWLICREFKVTAEGFCHSLACFEKPPHRLEFVQTIDGVRYYNDSKGTNIDAVIQAVGALKGKGVLIAGGVDKGSSYSPWKSFQQKVKHIVAIGQAAGKIAEELQGEYPVDIVPTLFDAVALASQLATSGEYVLLSPGCSSFDMFRDYAHRGEEFKSLVNHLKKRNIQ